MLQVVSFSKFSSLQFRCVFRCMRVCRLRGYKVLFINALGISEVHPRDVVGCTFRRVVTLALQPATSLITWFPVLIWSKSHDPTTAEEGEKNIFLGVGFCSYVLTHSWSWAFLEEPPIVQPVENFPTFYGTRNFNTVFIRAIHWYLSWAISIQSTPSFYHTTIFFSARLSLSVIKRGLPGRGFVVVVPSHFHFTITSPAIDLSNLRRVAVFLTDFLVTWQPITSPRSKSLSSPDLPMLLV
jgi:hypothetical protein